jgi:hypothetical protein
MKHKTTLFLETDSIDWCETVRINLERQRNAAVSLSEAFGGTVAKCYKALNFARPGVTGARIRGFPAIQGCSWLAQR